MTFLHPADVGDLLLAEATERSGHGRSGLYDVTVIRVDSELHRSVIAEMRGRSVTLTGNPFPAQLGVPATANAS